MDITLQLRIAKVAQRIDAADQFVELEYRFASSILLGKIAQLPDQRALGHFLEAECGNDLVDIGFLLDDQLPIDLTNRLDQIALVFCRIVAAEEVLELSLQMGKARLQSEAKPVQNREVSLVNAVHVTGYCAWRDIRGVVVTDVEHIMTFVFMSANQLAL